MVVLQIRVDRFTMLWSTEQGYPIECREMHKSLGIKQLPSFK
jgi:hypothetical protein